MTSRALLLGLSALVFAAAAASGQGGAYGSSGDTRAALRDALAERAAAERRSASLQAQAAEARDAASRAASETAALAARIQQAEAGIAAARARIALVERERRTLGEALGREQRPLVRLTAALQQFSRRPVALSMLRPGEVRDLVYLRAILASAVPQVQDSTAGLRTRIARAAELRRTAAASVTALEAEESELALRRTQLAEIETRERLAARAAGGRASREAERALALAEQARDLDGLLGEFDRAAALRSRLADLPGPRLRPAAPESAEAAVDPRTAPAVRGAPSPYVLPVTGRTTVGFGSPQPAGPSRGITLAPIAGAQVVAPGAGRVAFAGPYRGYGRIVIIEHAGGWTSLVTGLARIDVAVGQDLVGGAPLGTAAPARPSVTLELRRDGEPVNPLNLVS